MSPPQRHTSRTSEGCVINNQQDRWQHRLHLEVATPSAPWRTHIKELCDIQATQWGVLHPDKCTKAPFSCPVPKQQWLLQKKVWQGREDPPFFPPKSHFQYRLLKHRTLGSLPRKHHQRKDFLSGLLVYYIEPVKTFSWGALQPRKRRTFERGPSNAF